jgi:xylulokinase
MRRRAFLGVDCGTQSTKALLLDADSDDILAVGRAPHDLTERSDGTREQHPDQWIAALRDAVREAIAQAGPVELAGIGVSGQQHGLVCLDECSRPVRAAKLWNDTTTAAECETLTGALGGTAEVQRLTGNVFLTGYTAPKVMWLRRNEPGSYAATRRICLPHDYLNLWLTGEFVTEPGDASGTAYFDVRARHYSAAVLGAIDEQREWASTLPKVVESRSIAGQLRADAAEALGVRAAVPVSAGGGDNMCAAIGIGAVVEGPVAVSLGTSGTAFAYRGRPAIDPRGEAAAFCDSTGAWLPLACTLNCTVATDWIGGLFGMDLRRLDASLARSPEGASGLTFLPHLCGERTPDCPNGAAAFTGIRPSHGADDFVRAVVEGVTFGLSYALEALRRSGVAPSEITLVGGGAASDAWAQLCANVFRFPVRRPSVTEAAAAGAALQARWVVDGVPPPRADGDARRWEPIASAELVAAAARAAGLRELAVSAKL